MIKNFKIEILFICILLICIIFLQNQELNLNLYFADFKNNSKLYYLNHFFVNITEFGDSLWYFLFSFFFIAIYLITKNLTNLLKSSIKYKNFFIFNSFIFASLFATGVITQIIKHVVGRPRPNTVFENNSFDFNFFSLDSNFHSFPSGHSSTIFVVALVLGFFIPKLKYLLYLLAIIVSFSRVAIGAHYITDIIGGIVVAHVGLKITINLFNNYFGVDFKKNNYSLINDSFYSSSAFLLLLAVFLMCGSSFDIYFSKLFQNENGSFFLQRYYFNIEIFNYNRGTSLTILFRKLFLLVILLYIFVLPLFSKKLFIQKLYFGYIFKFNENVFLWLSSLFGLIFIINLALKNFWGRARPNEVLDFGGTESFTPWYQITNQCINNCSFVSGDSSVGFALIIFYFLVNKKIYLWVALILGFGIGMLRIMEGAHFISDIVLSGAIIFVFYSLCYRFYLKICNV